MSDYQKEEAHSREAPHESDPLFTRAELCELWEAIQYHCGKYDSNLNPESAAPKAAESAWAKLEEWVSLNVDPADTDTPEDVEPIESRRL